MRKRDADVALAGFPGQAALASLPALRAGRIADCPHALAGVWRQHHGRGDGAAAHARAERRYSQSYPFKLEALLRASYPDQFFSVVNAGKPGEPAEDAVLRLPGLLQAESPEMVILLHGLNDITFFGQGSVSRTLGHVETLVHQAKSGGAQVMLCTQLPQRAEGFRAADPRVLASFNDGIRQLALREGVFLIDLSRDFGDLGLIGIDGVHPTEAGYDRMAEMLLHALRSRFEWSSMSETVQ